MLFAEARGKGGRVVAVHGFTQTRLAWSPVVERLDSGHQFILVDAPGHGRSAGVHTGLWEGAELLGSVGGPAAYLGYSMGARLCLHLALARPDLVNGLVLVGVHPGIADPVARAARHADDERLARRLETDGLPRVRRVVAATAPFLDPAGVRRGGRRSPDQHRCRPRLFSAAGGHG